MRYLEKQNWSAKENHFFRLCLADLAQPAPLALNPVGRSVKAALEAGSRSSALSLPGEASAISSPAHADHEDCFITHEASTV